MEHQGVSRDSSVLYAPFGSALNVALPPVFFSPLHMTTNIFTGILPAILTPFEGKNGSRVNYRLLAREARDLLTSGCDGIVWPGSMGEWQTLSFEEKVAGWTTLRSMMDGAELGHHPLIAAIASLSTAEAVALARAAAKAGATGLMVLPPSGFSPKMHAGVLNHFIQVMNATKLPSMVYNNPPAYLVDLTPDDYAYLGKHVQDGRLAAVKESHPNPMQIDLLRRKLPESINVLVGLDGNMVTGVLHGACGWVAGLPVALPKPCARLFTLAMDVRLGRLPYPGVADRARALAPLFDIDAQPDLVQGFKFCMELAGKPGFGRVREPRRPLTLEQQKEISMRWRSFHNLGPKYSQGL